MAGPCPICDADLVADARFCHECGTAVDRVILQIDDTSSGAEDASSSPGGWRSRLVAVGILVLVAGVVAGLIASSDGDADTPAAPVPAPTPRPWPTPSPTTRAVEAERPVPDAGPEPAALGSLTWTDRGTVGSGRPLGVERTEAGTFLFTTDGSAATVRQEQPDGRWAVVEPGLPLGARVTAVDAGGGDLVVAGVDERGRTLIWRSTDGRTWVASPPLDLDVGTVVAPTTLAVLGDDVVVGMGPAFPDVSARVEQLLGAELAPGVEAVWAGPPLRAEVRGPGAIVLATFTAKELGLAGPDAEASFTFDTSPYEVWRLADGTWRRAAVEPGWVAELAATEGIFVGLMSVSSRGPVVHTSSDGLTWTSSGIRASSIAAGPGGFAALDAADTLTVADLGRSTVVTVPIADLVRSPASTTLTPTVDEVTAVVVELEPESRPSEPRDVVVLVDGLEIGRGSGEPHLTVTDAAGRSYRVPIDDDAPAHPSVRGDAIAGTISFARPAGDGTPVVLTVAQVERLVGGGRSEVRPQVVVATLDGTAFHVSPLAAVIDDAMAVQVTAVGSTLHLLATRPADDGVTPVDELRLWTADVPTSGRVEAALPDGTRFVAEGDVARTGDPVDGVAAQIVALEGADRVFVGTLAFQRSATPTAGRTGSTIRWATGSWLIRLDVTADVIRRLGEDEIDRLVADTELGLVGGVPTLSLPAGFRWADDDEATPMQVTFDRLAVRRGCSPDAFVCSDDGSLQAVLLAPLDDPPDLTLRPADS